jgi:hypothetical protein
MAMSDWISAARQTGMVAQRTGVRADRTADRSFRLAAVKLAGQQRESDARKVLVREAADALVSLAIAGEDRILRNLLRPDPPRGDVAWTVACYQIGDLAPSALEDFSNPINAIRTLVACSEPSHVAAELVGSTTAGVRWTAMTRTGELVRFQLPDANSASDASQEHPGELDAALEHWAEQLVRWSAHGGDDPAVGGTGGPDAAGARFDALDRRLDELQAGIETRLGRLQRTIDDLTSELQSFRQKPR